MGFSQGHRSNTAGTRRHHGRSVTSGSMSVSGSIRGAELYFIHGASNFNTAATKFLPMGYNDVESSGATFLNRFVAPCRGRWVETLVRSSVAADHTLMKLYKAVDATANPATLVETANLDLAAAATTYALTSSTGATITIKVMKTATEIKKFQKYMCQRASDHHMSQSLLVPMRIQCKP